MRTEGDRDCRRFRDPGPAIGDMNFATATATGDMNFATATPASHRY